jgi:hypothetical protein
MKATLIRFDVEINVLVSPDNPIFAPANIYESGNDLEITSR